MVDVDCCLHGVVVPLLFLLGISKALLLVVLRGLAGIIIRPRGYFLYNVIYILIGKLLFHATLKLRVARQSSGCIIHALVDRGMGLALVALAQLMCVVLIFFF